MNLKDLYQEIIIDHNRYPRNFRVIENHDCSAVGHNSLCGDKLIIYARLEDNKIIEVSFVGDGCAISKASASIMTEWATGKTVDEFKAIYQKFHHTLTTQDDIPDELGKAKVLVGVREFPARVKCATLAWHTLEAALNGNNETKTE